jgi:uncharacterized damage-inducible protein DinB
MKELLKEYAVYNVWANQKLCEVIQKVPEEKQKQQLPSSFESLYQTVLHMWNAESGWWQRVKMQEHVIMPGETFTGNMQELCSSLLHQSKLWEEWISGASELSLQHVFHYQNTKKEMFRQPVYQVILHVFNHATYHRGQLINMLRQLGFENLPGTDFISFARGRK